MAISVTLLDSGAKEAATSHTTASITPGSGLIMLGLRSLLSGGTAVVPTSVAGCGLTFDLIGNVSKAGGALIAALYRAAGTPTAGQITVTFADAQSLRYFVAEVSGVTVTSNGADGIAQSKTAANQTTSPIDQAFDDAFASADNGGLALIATGLGGTLTPRSGWTEFSDDGAVLEAQYRADNDTAFGGASTNPGFGFFGIGVELVAEVGVPDMQADVTTGGEIDGRLTVLAAFRSSIGAAGDLVGDLTVLPAFAASVDGAGDLAANLTLIPPLAATVDGAGDLAADLTVVPVIGAPAGARTSVE